MAKRRKYQDVSDLTLPDSSRLEDRAPRNSGENPSLPQPSKPGAAVAALRKPLKMFGSLVFGIVIMLVLALLLAWGTMIEKSYGAGVSQFFLYHTNWFALLLGLLGVNILCAGLSRFPWKFHHAPFLIAHFGILLLLGGCLMTWLYSQEGRVFIWEGWASSKASNTQQQVFSFKSIGHGPATSAFEDTAVRFTPGPFPWRYYDSRVWDEQIRNYRLSLGWAARWSRRDQGVMTLPTQLEGIRIEPLDYLANSGAEAVEPLEVNLLWSRPLRSASEAGEDVEARRNWERARLVIRENSHPMLGPMTPAGNQTMLGGEQVSYSMATSMEEVRAFTASAPDWTRDSGAQGQIVLYYNGNTFYFDPQKLLAQYSEGARCPLPGTSLEIGDVRFQYRMFLFQFKVYSSTGEEVALRLQPRLPDLNRQGDKLGVYGAYWLPPPPQMRDIREYAETSSMAMLGSPRLEFLQGTDRKLYYRYWTGRDVAAVGPVPAMEGDGKTAPEWTLAAGTSDEVKIAVKNFVFQDLPGQRIVSKPLVQNNPQAVVTPRLQVKATVDGKEEIFWTELESPAPRYLVGNGRTVGFSWNYEQFDLGFAVLLKKFEERNEPGGRIATHFSSLVDFGTASEKTNLPLVRYGEFHSEKKDVLISMNRPALYQGTGKRYRLYQLERRGPVTPSYSEFFQFYDGKIFPWEMVPREQVYASILKAHYDPGSGLKYLGCFLIIFGMCWHYYRKRTV